MSSHWITLPRPDLSDGKVVRALEATRTLAEQGQWLAVHVLYSECGCSKRVFDHLFRSQRPAGVAEKVLLVKDDDGYRRRAKAAGFSVHVVSPAQLQHDFGIEAAPALIVLSPTGEVHYLGGYTERKQGPDFQDVDIIRRVANAQASTNELPLYGCGTSEELQNILDPFGVKY